MTMTPPPNPGKLTTQAANAAKQSGNVFYILNDKIKFVIDSGAEVSVYPTPSPKPPPQQLYLKAANNTRILTYGTKRVSLFIDNKRCTWDFVLADVSRPLIGADFLRAFGLLVDVRNRRLICLSDSSCSNLNTLKGVSPLGLNSIAHASDSWGKILADFPSITEPKFSSTPAHNTFHHIVTAGPPPVAKARRLSPTNLEIARKAFLDMLSLNIVRRSNSPYRSALVLVKKPDGSMRICGDYTALNWITKPDSYPLPHLHDFTTNLHQCTIFSKVDLVKGYHQVPMAPEDVQKTAVATPFGAFEYLRMPYGLRNAAQTFQRAMDIACQGLDFLFVYLDDVLVASRSKDEHKLHLRLLFERLSKNGFAINPKKCVFAKQSLIFLGHKVDSTGISPIETRTEAIKTFPRPVKVKQLQEFLGLLNFYHRFLPHAAETLVPLHDLLKTHTSSRSQQLTWSNSSTEAFNKARLLLSNATLLHHPDRSAPLALTTDTSGIAVGAVLEQHVQGSWQPLGFFSKRLRPAETRYSAFDRELLSIYLAIKHFRFYLEGSDFTVYTDHKPLVFMFGRSNDPWSARQARHIAKIAEFTTNVVHVSGKANVVADALSRALPIQSVSLHFDYSAIAKDQESDALVEATVRSSSITAEEIPLENSSRKLLCDTSTGRLRPILPSNWTKKAFELVHNLYHPGIASTVKQVSAKFVWKDMSKQVAAWARTCIACQTSKTHRHTKPEVHPFSITPHRFRHIHLDLVGPLPSSNGFTHFISIIDRFTRWPVAVPLASTDAASCARALIRDWISTFGLPATITSDRGPQFVSAVWSCVCRSLGISQSITTSYHPQSNGLVERLHRHVKASLTARSGSSDWVDQLPWILLGIRTSYRRDLRCAPIDLTLGAPVSLPGDLWPRPQPPETPARLASALNDKFSSLLPIPTAFKSNMTAYVPQPLHTTTHVFIRNETKKPLGPTYLGPFKVVKRLKTHFIVDIRGTHQSVALARLKPAFIEGPTPLPNIPPLGRPRT